MEVNIDTMNTTQDDTVTELATTKNPAANSPATMAVERRITHEFIEIGGELLAKPQALCDVLEVSGYPTALIFCNSPSDTDLVEVLLKKKGINANKLIGHVPPAKVHHAMERISSKEISALVVTDIAARGLNVSAFPVIVQYSLQDDPDVYKERLHLTETEAQASPPPSASTVCEQRVITLVSPLDVANFHSIRKYLGFEFQEGKLPVQEDLMRARVQNLATRARERGLLAKDQTKTLVKLVLDSHDREEIIALLVHNTFEALPQISSELEKAQEREFIDDSSYDLGGRGDSNDRQGGRERSEGGRGGRNGGNGRGRGGGRGSRDNDRRQEGGDRRMGGGRSGGRNGGRGWAPGDDIDDEYVDEQQPMPRERAMADDSGDERSERPRSGEGYQRRSREPIQRIKEERVYFGIGSAKGFSQNELGKLLSQHCGLGQDSIKRFSLRSGYAFADFAEEVAPQVLEKLAQSSLPSGESLFITKAITLSTAVNPPPGAAEGRDDATGGDSFDEEGAGGYCDSSEQEERQAD